MTAIPRNSEFFKSSVQVAESFLQTAVVFDDSAEFYRYEAPTNITAPDEAPIRTESQAAQVMDADTDVVDSEENGAHFLYAKAVIDGFAKKRIICSVIKPEKDDLDESVSVMNDLARSADIVVLDWSIYKDNGKTALDILSNAIKGDDSFDSGQLRLFAVYTGAPELSEIFEKIQKRLATELEDEEKEIEEREEEKLSYSFGSAKVILLAKSETPNLLPEFKKYVVPFEELVDRLTEEFAGMTAGLVSNTVLNSLAVVRRNTHRILTRFQGRLDAPYLTHRFMLPDPEEAEALLISMITEEFYGLLEDAESGKMADLSMIEAWLDAINPGELKLENDVSIRSEDVLSILESGYNSWTENRPENTTPSKSKLKKSGRQLHTMALTAYFSGLTGAAEDADWLDEHFSHVTMIRSRYNNTEPTLSLGTIIRHEAETEESCYFVCIQPRCDCVRVFEERKFLFLPLEKNEKHFDFVVCEDDSFHRLICRRKPFDLQLIPFNSSHEDGRIRAVKNNVGNFEIMDCNNVRYQWLGELRGDHGLRLTNQFAVTLSRIGLDEAEWLRRYATR
ncbi:MAG: hypothetical protein KDD92_17960 [Caldilineaceae bacterium]|nr:hypothetical protein [Caldilineaceae bacterium]